MQRTCKPLHERFDRYYSEGDGCWLWTGAHTLRGYGQIYKKIDGRNVFLYSHRVAYERWIGPIPKGLLVCHRCDEPSCVNPGHLFVGTQKDNMRDAKAKGRLSGKHNNCGEHNPRAKLSWAKVDEIRSSSETHKVLANRFGVSPALISMVKSRMIWNYD